MHPCRGRAGGHVWQVVFLVLQHFKPLACVGEERQPRQLIVYQQVGWSPDCCPVEANRGIKGCRPQSICCPWRPSTSWVWKPGESMSCLGAIPCQTSGSSTAWWWSRFEPVLGKWRWICSLPNTTATACYVSIWHLRTTDPRGWMHWHMCPGWRSWHFFATFPSHSSFAGRSKAIIDHSGVPKAHIDTMVCTVCWQTSLGHSLNFEGLCPRKGGR